MLHEWEFDIVLSNIVMDFIRHRAGTQYDSVDCAFIPFHARPYIVFVLQPAFQLSFNQENFFAKETPVDEP